MRSQYKHKSYAPVTTLEKSLSLIEFIGKSQGITPVEAATALGFSRASVHRILATLQSQRYITEQEGKYRLTYKLFSLCNNEHYTQSLKSVVLPYMLDLSKLTGEQIRLTVQQDTNVISIEEVRSRHFLTLNSDLINAYPAYCCASGIIFLSKITDQQIRELISEESLVKKTDTTPTTHAKLLVLVGKAREQGYCLENGIFSDDINSLSAPIFDGTGRMIAAISISGPKQRLTNETLLKYLQPLQETTRNISMELGY